MSYNEIPFDEIDLYFHDPMDQDMEQSDDWDWEEFLSEVEKEELNKLD